MQFGKMFLAYPNLNKTTKVLPKMHNEPNSSGGLLPGGDPLSTSLPGPIFPAWQCPNPAVWSNVSQRSGGRQLSIA